MHSHNFNSWLSKVTVTGEAGGVGNPISHLPPFCLAKGTITPRGDTSLQFAVNFFPKAL